jgi:hypothetical protein
VFAINAASSIIRTLDTLVASLEHCNSSDTTGCARSVFEVSRILQFSGLIFDYTEATRKRSILNLLPLVSWIINHKRDSPNPLSLPTGIELAAICDTLPGIYTSSGCCGNSSGLLLPTTEFFNMTCAQLETTAKEFECRLDADNLSSFDVSGNGCLLGYSLGAIIVTNYADGSVGAGTTSSLASTTLTNYPCLNGTQTGTELGMLV